MRNVLCPQLSGEAKSNFSSVFMFVSCEEIKKNYYLVHSLGQLKFDCGSYCGRSRLMQGEAYKHGMKIKK